MTDIRPSLFLGDTADVHFVPSPTAPCLWISDEHGTAVMVHLNDGLMDSDAKRATAIANLDQLAAAVQQAMVALAPERFAQPGPDDPDDEPTDEPVGQADGVLTIVGTVTPAGQTFTRQAHPMSENELRAAFGDR